MNANTLFLRFEGPLQSWGDHNSKFIIRRTAEAPTKSGVIGLLLAALGIPRSEAPQEWLPKLKELKMGVRIDNPGIRWWDYHTVGARMKMVKSDFNPEKPTLKVKEGAMLTHREFLCDASFLVALQGNPEIIAKLEDALKSPRWTLYLGRKCCPPSRPILADQTESQKRNFTDLISALKSVPFRLRFKEDSPPTSVECLVDWIPTPDQKEAPEDALIYYDVPLSLDPPAHEPRFVIRKAMRVGTNGDISIFETPAQNTVPSPLRPRADYTNTEYKNQRNKRLDHDNYLCVFCKAPATTVQHITYQRAGGNESLEDLRSLCRLCHDAVTMLEYGLAMGLDRINPEDPRWRTMIIQKRDEIIRFRSLEKRRRRLLSEEVE